MKATHFFRLQIFWSWFCEAINAQRNGGCRWWQVSPCMAFDFAKLMLDAAARR